MGLSMAKAGNTNLAEIRSFFRMPEPERFKIPLATDPAAKVAATPVAATHSM
jgi:hypothetical protein